MSIVVFTSHFEKQLYKLGLTKKEIGNNVKQYQNNDRSYINLGVYEGMTMCKDYLKGGRIRLLVLAKFGNYYLPVVVVEKDSYKGKNIRKDNIDELFGIDIEKCLNEFVTKNFVVFEIND